MGSARKFKYSIIAAIILSLLPLLFLLVRNPQALGSTTQTLANIIGLSAGILFIWQFILGLRFVSRKFTPDYISVVHLHIFVGTYATILVFLHPLLQMVSQSWSLSYIAGISIATSYDTYLLFGKLALLLFLTIWLTSAIFRRKLSYRLWNRLHYLTHLMILFIFIHSLGIGSLLNTYPALEAYWLFFFGVYITLVAWRVLRFFNFGRARYRLVEKSSLANGVTQYVLRPTSKVLKPDVGQFMFVRHSFFSEIHPFSVMEFDEKSGQIAFGIKNVGKYTNQLAGLNVGKKLYIGGPYGVFTKEAQNDEPKVVIAGGIGITPFVELVRRYSNEQTHLIYANRTLDNAVRRNEFKKELEANYVDVISDEKSNEPVVHGILDKKTLQKLLPKSMLEENKFFICGPPLFMAAVVKSLNDFGVQEDRIFLEEFRF
jgi:3-phenylpropionate/trans-cinnamate dioxygenase ferredoxin reductase subunit